MLKRFFLLTALTIGLAAPSFGAGTIPLSLTQRIDKTTFKPLAAGKLYFIQAGTTSTPQNAYQDSALTIAWPNPITLDPGGNIPQLFFADGSIKIRLTNAQGVVQLAQDGILVVGASSGSGGGSSVDATTVLATGDLKTRYGTGNLSGFVRANGRTIGSATSGASERANADCQSLFEYLWAADTNLSVSTGRGASANADWVANKTIALPDWRGRVIAGLDDMGNSAALRLSAGFFGAVSTVLGAAGGVEGSTLVTNNLPPYTPAGSITTASTLSTWVKNTGTISSATASGGSEGIFTDVNAVSMGNVAGTGTFTGTAQGGTSYPVRTVQPTMLATIYLKL
jgi:hypothetical protein